MTWRSWRRVVGARLRGERRPRGAARAPARPALGGRPPLRPPSDGSGLRPLRRVSPRLWAGPRVCSIGFHASMKSLRGIVGGGGGASAPARADFGEWETVTLAQVEPRAAGGTVGHAGGGRGASANRRGRPQGRRRRAAGSAEAGGGQASLRACAQLASSSPADGSADHGSRTSPGTRSASDQASPRIKRAAFAAIIRTGAAVLPLTMTGIALASTTRSPSIRPPRPSRSRDSRPGCGSSDGRPTRRPRAAAPARRDRR